MKHSWFCNTVTYLFASRKHVSCDLFLYCFIKSYRKTDDLFHCHHNRQDMTDLNHGRIWRIGKNNPVTCHSGLPFRWRVPWKIQCNRLVECSQHQIWPSAVLLSLTWCMLMWMVNPRQMQLSLKRTENIKEVFEDGFKYWLKNLITQYIFFKYMIQDGVCVFIVRHFKGKTECVYISLSHRQLCEFMLLFGELVWSVM